MTFKRWIIYWGLGWLYIVMGIIQVVSFAMIRADTMPAAKDVDIWLEGK